MALQEKDRPQISMTTRHRQANHPHLRRPYCFGASRPPSVRVIALALSVLYMTLMLVVFLQHQSSLPQAGGDIGSAKQQHQHQQQQQHHPHIDSSFTELQLLVDRPPTTKGNPSKSAVIKSPPKKKTAKTKEEKATKTIVKPKIAKTKKETPASASSASTTTKKSLLLTKSESASTSTSTKDVIPETSTNDTLPSPHEHLQVQEYLQHTMNRSFLPLAAVLETSIGNTTTSGAIKPLPLRTETTRTLTTVSYPHHIQSCQDIPNHWPVGHGREDDHKYGPNVGTLHSAYKQRHEYTQTSCPVDADPFLPWIHDVFVDFDLSKVQFLAHNRRRCRRDPSHFNEDIANLEPQVTLMQSVPIQRILDGGKKKNMTTTTTTTDEELLSQRLPTKWKDTKRSAQEHWYRLVPLEQADVVETRFLCQFFTLRLNGSGNDGNTGGKLEKVVVEETWSTYPYNYEHANYMHHDQRGRMTNPMLTRPLISPLRIVGIHNEQVWNAILNFQCPIPEPIREQLQELQKQQQALTTTTTTTTKTFPPMTVPTFYVDVVPVRTPPRVNVTGYAPQLQKQHVVSDFDPIHEWGDAHILPPVSQSGRWANIPICPRPITVQSDDSNGSVAATTATNASDSHSTTSNTSNNNNATSATKPHFMVGCLWASAVFSERGMNNWDTHTIERLLEWLAYHLEIAGFDHMVVYDNTEAHTDATSLQSVTDLFPLSQVTRIPWKHRVCNNNGYDHPNGGERSSQYAAEASCRVRYGPTTEWLAFFDTDEYLIPSGNWSSIREWLQTGVQTGTIGSDTHILSFYETKALLNHRFAEDYVNDEVPECRSNCTKNKCHCVQKRSNATYLEAYCEPQPFPREFPRTKAKMKQIYRPAFVLNHFVHYATVTNFVHTRPHHPRVVGWPYERRAKEFSEAYMLHTKTRSPVSTSGWRSSSGQCRAKPHKCPVGLAFPFYQGFNATNSTSSTTFRRDVKKQLLNEEFGFPYNCYELEKVQEDLAVRLHAVLDPLKTKWKQTVGPNGIVIPVNPNAAAVG
jgi:hypothetical protein